VVPIGERRARRIFALQLRDEWILVPVRRHDQIVLFLLGISSND